MAISRPDLDSLLRRITVRVDVFGGKPIIRDLRISVEMIVSLLAQGVTVEDRAAFGGDWPLPPSTPASVASLSPAGRR